MTYTTVGDQDLGQGTAVSGSLPPHRLDGMDWGARCAGRPHKGVGEPWRMQGGSLCSHNVVVVVEGKEQGPGGYTIDGGKSDVFVRL